jgi:hypothetical protein
MHTSMHAHAMAANFLFARKNSSMQSPALVAHFRKGSSWMPNHAPRSYL